MKPAITIAAIGALLSVGWCVWRISLAADQMALAGQHAQALLGTSNALVSGAQKQVDGTFRNLNAVLLQAGLAADNARRASERQQEYSDKAIAVLTEATATLRGIQAATKQVGDGAEGALGEAQRTLVGVDTRLVELVAQVSAVSEVAAKQVGNPEIGAAVHELAEASKSTAEATAKANEAVGFLRDALKPTKQSFWRMLIQLVIPKPTVRIGK